MRDVKIIHREQPFKPKYCPCCKGGDIQEAELQSEYTWSCEDCLYEW